MCVGEESLRLIVHCVWLQMFGCEIHVKCFFLTKSYGVKAQGSDSILSILKGKSVFRNENDKCVWTYSLTGEYF